MNCQIVLCKGVNDGEALSRSLSDLERLYPAVHSVSIVPVGLTRFRDGLYPLEPFSPDDCREVISRINAVGDRCCEKYGVRLFYPSDEFFIVGGVQMPGEDWYDGYPQIENGVGLTTSLMTEVSAALKDVAVTDRRRSVAIVTGVLAADTMRAVADEAMKRCPQLRCEVYPIVNRFFGERITVSGLVTGTDIIDQLKGKDLPETVLIPCSMLRAEQDMFLDSVTVGQVEKEISRKITVVCNDGYDLINNIIGE